MENSVKEKDPTLQLLTSQFEEFSDASLTARRRSEMCRDYRDGKQWTEAEQATLRARKQPIITDNKIADKVDALLGLEQQTRTDPKAFPRTPAHEEGAQAATDALRYIADSNNFQRTRAAACENLMIEGLCAGEVVVEKRKGREPQILMRRIRWDRVYWDPHALESDFSDKQYVGFFTWMDHAQAKREWPNGITALENSFTDETSADQTFEDKPRYISTSRGRRRVQVFETYFKQDGVWHRAVWCRGGFLEEPKPSAYLDQYGEPDCCIELQACFRDKEGNPYGLVDRFLDRQDEINKRRSKMLHLLNSKTVIAEKGAVEDVDFARKEVHKPDGYVEITPQMRFDIDQNTDLAQGQWQLLVETTNSLALSGPNAALLGQTGSVSGKAKQIDQQAGTLPVSPIFDALRAWQLRMYRHAWNRVRQYWTQEMWVRVTDDDKGARFVSLNRRLTNGDVLARKLKADPRPIEEKQAIIQQMSMDPGAQVPAVSPDGMPVVENNVAELDVDIIIDEAPDVVTVQQEQYAGLLELAKARPEIPLDLLIEASSLRNKKQVIDRIKGQDDPMAQQMAQLQQVTQQLQAALLEANVRKTNAQAAQAEAAAAETQVDASVKVAEFTDPATAQPAGKTQVSVN